MPRAVGVVRRGRGVRSYCSGETILSLTSADAATGLRRHPPREDQRSGLRSASEIASSYGKVRGQAGEERGHRHPVRAGGGPRHGQRRPLRLRRGPAADLRARRLRAEHHHARLRIARRGGRRVLDAAPRRRALRSDLAEAAAGDFRGRGRRLRAALRAERAAHRPGGDARRARPGALRDHRPLLAAEGRQHDHPAARPRAVSGSGRVPRSATPAPSARSRNGSSRSRSRSATPRTRSSRFYANQTYLGEGAYGVEAASRTYFGKSAKDLNLDEAATIAGLFQTLAQRARR